MFSSVIEPIFNIDICLKENLKSSTEGNNNSEHNKEESNEPDYDYEDKDQLEEEAGEIMTSSTTTNQIFWINLHFKRGSNRVGIQTGK